MFHCGHWAEAFINSLGAQSEKGLDCLKSIVPAVRSIPGEVFGHSISRRLEALLRESAAVSGLADDTAAEYAIRFITMLVEKNCFRYIDALLQHIEQKIDEKNGVLDVIAESALPLDGAFEEELRQKILKESGAAGIRIQINIKPELLAGWRVHIGGFQIDASLKGQLEQMKSELEASAVFIGA